MLISEEERFAYFASWDLRTLRDCQVLLNQFKCCDRLIEHISDFLTYTGKELSVATGMSADEKKLKMEANEVRACSHCKDGKVFIFKMRACEQKRTGRMLYEECQSCDYWAETIASGVIIKRYEFGELKEVK